MNRYPTREAARRLGIGFSTLSKYISQKLIPLPHVTRVEGVGVWIRLWSDVDIERVRKLLPKIKNGRKTRYKKQRKQTKKK